MGLVDLQPCHPIWADRSPGPGGYLQWQEVDIIDVWATPCTEAVRQAITNIVLEKIERGLILS